MSRRILALVVASVAAAPLVAAAQQSTQPVRVQNPSSMPCGMHAIMMGPMMHSPMMDSTMAARKGGMMSHMPNDSSMMDEMRKQLDLTAAQVQQMRAIHQRVCAAAQPHLQMAMQAHQAAMQALMSDNLNDFKAQMEKAAQHMVAAQVEMAKGMIEFHKSLTPAQRQKMEQMHQRMMHGG